MEYTEKDIETLKESFDEAIDKAMPFEELNTRWYRYRRALQTVLRVEFKKIDRSYLSENEKQALKRFKSRFLSSNSQFRHMMRMLDTDVEVRNLMARYEGINEYLMLFENGYGFSLSSLTKPLVTNQN